MRAKMTVSSTPTLKKWDEGQRNVVPRQEQSVLFSLPVFINAVRSVVSLFIIFYIPLHFRHFFRSKLKQNACPKNTTL